MCFLPCVPAQRSGVKFILLSAACAPPRSARSLDQGRVRLALGGKQQAQPQREGVRPKSVEATRLVLLGLADKE